MYCRTSRRRNSAATPWDLFYPGYTCRRDKNESPVIHFVIRHPKMCTAIENMVLPVIESEERSKEP